MHINRRFPLTPRSLVAALAAAGAVAAAQPLLASAAGGETAVKATAALAGSACLASHTASSGPTFNGFCVSKNGNLTSLESPQGVNNLGTDGGEGYLLCDSNGLHGFDAGPYGSQGFGPPTVTHPNAPSAFPMTVVRTTTDGIYRLTQTFAADDANRGVSVSMVLRNISGVVRTGVVLYRYADLDVGGSSGDDTFAATGDSVIGLGADNNQAGVQMTATDLTQTHAPFLLAFSSWNGGGTKSSCTPETDLTPTAAGDHVAMIEMPLSTLLVGSKVTAGIRYATL